MASLTDQLPVYGGAGDDALTGGIAAEVIHGDAGDDTLSGGGGADTLIGGLGDDLLFGGAGANVLYGGAGSDILTYDSADADGDLQRLFGGEGANTLVLEFTQDDYLQPGVIAEVLAYANALAEGENPGGGAEFVFQSFALRASNFSSILIFVDGDPIAPGEVPGVDAVDDAFDVAESGSVTGNVAANDNFPAGAAVSLLTPPANGDLTLQADGAFTFSADGAFETLSAGDVATVTFTYRLTDGDDVSDGVVAITVAGENDAPTAGAAAAATGENQPVSGDLIADSSAADVDQNDTLTVQSVNGQALNGATRTIALPSGATVTVAPDGGYTYTPGAAFDSLMAGDDDADTVSFVLSDGRGGQVASTLTLTITGENDAPVANPDVAATTEDAAIAFDVVGNDDDIDQGDVLTLASIDGISGGGTATITPTGQILFDPLNDFQTLSVGANAFVEIEYTVEDAAGARSSSTATVTVTGVNDAPTANDVDDATSEDVNLTGNLLTEAAASDIDSADVLTIGAIDGVAFNGGFSAQIASGAMLTVMANGDYVYSPASAFNGLGVGETASDSFTFTITDGRGGAVTQTFSIEIAGENDGPVVQDVTATVAENDSVDIDFLGDSNAVDPDDNGVLTLGAINGVQPNPQAPFFNGSNGGVLTEGLAGFTFDTLNDFETLSVGDVATTTFTFTIVDDQGAAATRTLTVEVEGTNDDPTADPVEFLTDEDTAATGNLLADSGAADIDQNDTLVVTEILADGLTDGALNGAARTFVFDSGAALTVAPNGAFTFLPSPADQALAPGERTVENFAFRVSDGQGGEIIVSVDASVDGLNDDPTADAITRGALEDDTVFGDLLADANAADIDNSDILRVVQIDGQLVDSGGVTFNGAEGGALFVNVNGGYTFNPNGDFEFLSVGDTATSSFDFRIGDSFGGFVDQTITFEIAGANDAPEVDPIDAATDEDTAFSGNFLDDGSARDIDQNDTLTVTRIIADGLADGALNGATQVFTLSSGAQLTVSPDGAFTYDPLQAFQSLPEGGADTDFLSFQIADGNGGLATESLTIAIAGVNDAPTLDPIAVTVGENSTTTGDLISDSNAADVDQSDTVTIFTLEGQDFSAGTVTITRPGEGRLQAEGRGYTYQTLADFDFLSVGETATTAFEFTVADTFAATATTTITFTITGENDGPTANDVAQSTTEDDILDRNLLSDSAADDVDQSDVLTISRITIDGVGVFDLNGAPLTQALANGAVLTVNPDGGYQIDPAGNFDGLAPGDVSETSFNFTVSDGNGGEVERNAVITITGVNDAPVAADDTATTDQNTLILIDVLGNDSDVDGTFAFTSLTQPDNGGLALTGNGVAFDPNGDFDVLGDGEQATTTFTYTITDNLGATDTADVVVTVTGLNDAPIVTPLNATTDEDRAAFMVDLLAGQVDVDQNDVLSVENFVEIDTTFGDFTVVDGIFTIDARQFDFLIQGDPSQIIDGVTGQIIDYSYDVVDQSGARVTNTLRLTIEGRDEGLVAVDDSFSTDEDTPLNGDVSLNDTIGSGTFTVDQNVAAGLLVLNSDGTFSFDPNGDFDDLADGEQDSATFTYILDDGLQTVTATAVIDILGVNDGPEADAVLFEADEDNPVSINLIDESNAADPDAGGPIELDSLDGVFLPLNNDDEVIMLSSGAVITASRDGEITYDPNGQFEALSEGEFGLDSFTFELVDDFGDGIAVAADVDILGVNDPLQAEAASFTANEDTGASGNLIDLSNVDDPDLNDDILISAVNGVDVTGGVTITIGSGVLLTTDEFGDFTYDTNGQFEGLATGETLSEAEVGFAGNFTYSITDGFATVDLFSDVTINGANDAPVIDSAASDLAETFTATGGGTGGGPALINVSDLNGGNGFALVADGTNERAGSAVAGGGDVNGDGFDDLVIAAPGYEYYYSSASGTAFVLFGDGQPTAPASRDIPEITPATDGISLLGDVNEQLGYDAAFVGDVNGDGFDDFLIGNGYSSANGYYRGVARLVFGSNINTSDDNAYLNATNSTEFIDSSTGFDGTRNLGASVASAGDINNDGIDDFIIGAPFSTQGLDDDFGKAFVVFGRSSMDPAFGATFDLASLDGTNGFRIDNGYAETGTYLGTSVSGVGDVNGDGVDDLVVGAPGEDQLVSNGLGGYYTYNTGGSYVIFGSDSGFGASVDVDRLTPSDGYRITDGYNDSFIGRDVAGIGDFNGDGIDDFAINAAGAYTYGAVFVVFGSSTPPQGNLLDLAYASSQVIRIDGARRYDYAGTSISSAGDFNGDGFDDLLIGASRSFEGLYTGEAYILFGTDQAIASPLDLTNFDADDGVRLIGLENGDSFGGNVSSAGDLNQDGFDDVIIGATGAGPSDRGAAFVFFGFGEAGGGGGVGGGGSVFFDDVDLTDTHVVSDDAINDDVTFTFDLLTDTTGGATGEAVWTATIDQDAFDGLGEGATEVTTVNVTITDPFGASDTETIEVTFVGVNDAPTAEDAARTTDEDTILSDGDLIVEGNVMDVDDGDAVRVSAITFSTDGGLQTVALSASPTDIFIRGAILSIDETGAYTLDPNGFFESLDTRDTSNVIFSYTVEDLLDETTEALATIAVTGVNDAPTANDDAATTDQDNVVGINLFANDVDPESNFMLRSLDPTSTTGDVVVENAALGTVVYNPNGQFDFLDAGEQATDTFSYLIQDSGGLVDQADVTVTINGLNDAPRAFDLTIGANEDDTVFGGFIADSGSFDPDANDTLVVQSVDGEAIPPGGTVVTLGSDATLFMAPNGTFTYDPRPGFQSLAQGEIGQDVISIVLSDGDTTDVADLIVNVTGVNDAPTAPPLARTTNEDEAAFVVDLLANAVDVDQGDVLSVENFAENQTFFGSFTQVGATFTLDATFLDDLDAGESQIINYAYDVVDSQGARVSTTLEVTVEGRDEALLAIDDAFSTNEDTPISGDVSTNDTDQGAVYSLVTQPDGDIVFNPDGTFDYDPTSFYNSLDDGAQAVDTFTYQIDNGTDQVTADVTITVDGINDEPMFFVPGVADVRLVTEDVSDTEGGNNASIFAAISGDGGTIVFNSNASNLIAGDTNVRTDVFFEDPFETIERANLENITDAQSTEDGATTAEVSADGKTIVFQSRANDLATAIDGTPLPDNNRFDIYTRSLDVQILPGVTQDFTQLLIPFGVDANRLNGDSTNASVSANGRFVAFQSTAFNIVSDTDDNNSAVAGTSLDDIFLHDRQTGETQLISQRTDTIETFASFRPTISADGGTVVFLTANSHDAADTNGLVDVYAYDVATDTLELISKSTAGVVGDQEAISFAGEAPASTPSVSANGRYVSWVSRATNLVDDDTNNADDIFVHDRVTGETERVSTTFEETEANGASFETKLSDNGRYVTFQSQATNLDDLAPDTNGDNDIYVKDRLTGDLIRVSITPDFSAEPGGRQPDISADGTRIAFSSQTINGNFDARVTTGFVDDIYVATIDTTGFNFSQNDTLGFVDLENEWFDADGFGLDFSNIDVTSDNADRVVSFTEVTDGGRVIGIDLVPGDFADLGVNDYELLFVSHDVTDGIALSSGVTGVVIVGENDAPTADDQTFEVNQGAAVSGSFIADDIDGDTLSFSFLPTALQGDLVVNTDGSFTYTAAADQAADESVFINVDDGNGGTTSFIATFDVNTPPTFGGATNVLVALTQEVDAGATNNIDVSGFFTDPEGTGLTFSAQQTSGSALPGGLSIDAVSGVISGTPGDNVNDLFRIEVTATDGAGLSTTGEFWLAVVDDILTGDATDQTLTEGAFSSFIDGLGGNDNIVSGDQTDIYQYTRGDGFNVINETGFQERDHLVLNGYTSTEVTFQRFFADPFSDNGLDLLIVPVGSTGDFSEGVLVRNGFAVDGPTRRISDFNFDDGVTITDAEVRAMIIANDATDGNDDIRGFGTADTLAGGLGDDLLQGGDGADTYVINALEGNDTIRDSGFSDNDVIQFNFDFDFGGFDLLNEVDSDDLIFDFGNGSSVTVVNAINNPNSDGIASFIFDNVTFSIQDIRDLLNEQKQTDGDDLIFGFTSGTDFLSGGDGDDTLIGRLGNDTYIYVAGDGDDTIIEQGQSVTGDDLLRVIDFRLVGSDTGNGFEVSGLSEVTFERGVDDLNSVTVNLEIAPNTDNPTGVTGSIYLQGGLTPNGVDDIERLIFETFDPFSGPISVEITNEDIRSDVLRQAETEGDDVIIGFSDADTLEGGQGNDTLTGGSGTDTYIFNIGDGDDIVQDNGNLQNDDIVVFADRAFSDVRIEQVSTVANNDLIITAGSDSIRVVGGLSFVSSNSVGSYQFTDQTVTREQMRDFLIAQSISEGVSPIGTSGPDVYPTTNGESFFFNGFGGNDVYTFASGDGDDTVTDNGALSNFDLLDMSAFNSTDFIAGGAGRIVLNPAFADEAIFEIGGDSLTVVGFGSFERIDFADQSFDRDANDGDGELNFADFIEANGVATRTLVSGDGSSETFVSTSANETFNGGGGTDTYVFGFDPLGSNIGSDTITQNGASTAGLRVVIDFSGSGANNVLQEDVRLSLSPHNRLDLVLDVIYEDSAFQFPDVGIGRFEERIEINNAFAGSGEIISLEIIDSQGGSTLLDSTVAISQVIFDQQVTEGDDLIQGYVRGNETLTGGAGNDTLIGDQGFDTYQFFVGDDKDVIADGFAQSGGNLVRIFDRTIDDAALKRDPANANNLIIDFGDDELTIQSFFLRNEIAQFDFEAQLTTPDSYTTPELTQIFLDRLTTDGDDLIEGALNTADTLRGGLGDDTLRGGDRSDLYILNANEGDDFVADSGSNAGGDIDVLQFNVASTEVTFFQNVDDSRNFTLVYDAGGSVEIERFTENNSSFNSFEFTDTTFVREDMVARAFEDLATDADDRIFGSSEDNNLRGGLGDDYLEGGNGTDVFTYAFGDGDDTLGANGTAANTIETIRLTGVDIDDVILARAPGSRDLDSNRSTEEDLLITFDSGPGSIIYQNGLRQSGTTNRIEIVDSGVTLTDADIVTAVLRSDLEAGRTYLEGANEGTVTFPGGARVIFSILGDDVYQYSAGDGQLIINDFDPSDGTQRLEITGYSSTDATFRRLAAGTEDYIIELPGGDQILSIGDLDGTTLINGVNEIFFAGDNVTFDDMAITLALDGGTGMAPPPGGGTGGSGGSPRTQAPSEPAAASVGDRPELLAAGEDDTLVLTSGDDIMRMGPGDDHVRGRGGADALWGQAGDDTLIGNGGADTLRGGRGEDELRGGGGRDKLIGGGGDDVLKGNGGRDMLKGGRGEDDLMGGVGNDVLKGGGGDDRIEGGRGNDRLIGQGGEDMFVFARGFGSDTIRDFRDGVDMLDFSGHASASALGDLMIEQVGVNAVITDGAGGRVTLLRVDANDLQEDDFLF